MRGSKFIIIGWIVFLTACSKKDSTPAPPPPPEGNFASTTANINGITINTGNSIYTNLRPLLKINFSAPVKQSSVSGNILFNESSGNSVPFSVSFTNRDSVIVLQPSSLLKSLTGYSVIVSTGLQSASGKNLTGTLTFSFKSGIDSTRKFPAISDSALLTLVQQQTFKYFWDFGHPVSGLARERNTSGDVVTTGGSGFGMMAIVTAMNRSFISRAEGLARLQKITGFLENTAQTFHGAFPHWLNGSTGAVIPFSPKDDGADLVETSFLVQGLLTARQYFSGADASETGLRNDINEIYNRVEWDWFRKGNEDVLYWHWSPNYGWDINQQIKGWNECLITYVLAASSPSHPVPKSVYNVGWASNGGIKNNNFYFGIQLPLGPPSGGPLFFAHYSFLGINPFGLSDAYAGYETQNINHTLINYNYCKANPHAHFGYSDSVWGLTASDVSAGYSASSPTNDLGVIAPTAALSSFPYTPVESMKALKFFYYVLGDKLWKEYGFVDAFSLQDAWFADSYLAIDQGPIIVMIENYRSGLLWNLFTGCPEVKAGMRTLGFTAPYL